MSRSNTAQGIGDGSGEILLVEDNPGDVRLTREALDEADLNHTLHVSTDGDAALEFLLEERSLSSLDLVLLDLNLPGSDGREVLETIRDDPRLQRLPVIVLTGSEDDDDIADCYAANANAYLTKPTDLDEFVETVEAIEQFWFEQVQLPPISQ